jgi:5'(3')-deoxyribonucleotidase
MLVGVDIDNVVAEFEAAFRGWINRHAGLALRRRDITSFMFADCCPLSHQEVTDLFRGFVRAGRLRGLSLIPHARAALRQLERRAEVCLVTARPPEEPIVEDTLYWLARKGLPHARVLWAERKSEVASGFSLFIEDNLEQARGLAERGVSVLLLDYPWNRAAQAAHPNIRRVRSWREALLQAAPQ